MENCEAPRLKMITDFTHQTVTADGRPSVTAGIFVAFVAKPLEISSVGPLQEAVADPRRHRTRHESVLDVSDRVSVKDESGRSEQIDFPTGQSMNFRDP